MDDVCMMYSTCVVLRNSGLMNKNYVLLMTDYMIQHDVHLYLNH